MIAGERTSPAATAVDDFTNVRRLNGAIFIDASSLVCFWPAIVAAAC
jgi:hypothetical protein